MDIQILKLKNAYLSGAAAPAPPAMLSYGFFAKMDPRKKKI